MSSFSERELAPEDHGASAIVKIIRSPLDELRQQAAVASQLVRSFLFVALRRVRLADIVRFIGRQVEVLHAAIRREQIIKHRKQQFVRVADS